MSSVLRILIAMAACAVPIFLVGGLIMKDSLKAREQHRAERIARETWYSNVARIRPGMNKSEVFGLIGNNCTTSYLQDGIEICEWKIKEYGSTVITHNHMGNNTCFSTVQQTNGNEFSFRVSFKDNIAVEIISGDRMV